MKPLARFLAALLVCAPALAFADDVRLQPTSDPSGAIKPVVSTALEASHVIKATPGNLFDFQVAFGTCASAPCWVLLFDATSFPANGAVTPIKWWQVAANSTLSVSWFLPVRLNTGIVIGCSTSGPFALASTAQCAISADAN